MTLQHGWAFPDADTFMRNELQPDGSYQRSHLDAALQYVSDWSLAIDGGAHVGTFSRVLSQRFVQVIAVEPALDSFEALRVNMLAFGCANVTRRQVALGRQLGRGQMVLDARNTARRNTGARYVVSGDDFYIAAIDDWQLPTLGFLKLDVEGAETDALAGAESTIKRCRPVVLYEDKGFGVRYGHAKRASAALLESFGYRHLCLAGADAVWGPA